MTHAFKKRTFFLFVLLFSCFLFLKTDACVKGICVLQRGVSSVSITIALPKKNLKKQLNKIKKAMCSLGIFGQVLTLHAVW